MQYRGDLSWMGSKVEEYQVIQQKGFDNNIKGTIIK